MGLIDAYNSRITFVFMVTKVTKYLSEVVLFITFGASDFREFLVIC